MLFLCSSVFGSRAQLGRWPSRGVTSWRPTNRAGNVRGVTKDRRQSACFYWRLKFGLWCKILILSYVLIVYGGFFLGLHDVFQCFLCHLRCSLPLWKQTYSDGRLESGERGRPKSPHLFMYYWRMLCSLAPQLLQGQLMFSLLAAVVVNVISRWLFRLIAALLMRPLD